MSKWPCSLISTVLLWQVMFAQAADPAPAWPLGDSLRRGVAHLAQPHCTAVLDAVVGIVQHEVLVFGDQAFLRAHAAAALGVFQGGQQDSLGQVVLRRAARRPAQGCTATLGTVPQNGSFNHAIPSVVPTTASGLERWHPPTISQTRRHPWP